MRIVREILKARDLSAGLSQSHWWLTSDVVFLIYTAISVSHCLPSESWPQVRLWSLSPQLISSWPIYLEPRCFLYSTQPQAWCYLHAIILCIWPKQRIWGRCKKDRQQSFGRKCRWRRWANNWADVVWTTRKKGEKKRQRSLSGRMLHKAIQQVCKDKIGTTTKHSNWK